eukprot:scaffold2359_cov102-Cylindrotheca_fusiformis.AAC.7
MHANKEVLFGFYCHTSSSCSCYRFLSVTQVPQSRSEASYALNTVEFGWTMKIKNPNAAQLSLEFFRPLFRLQFKHWETSQCSRIPAIFKEQHILSIK